MSITKTVIFLEKHISHFQSLNSILIGISVTNEHYLNAYSSFLKLALDWQSNFRAQTQ